MLGWHCVRLVEDVEVQLLLPDYHHVGVGMVTWIRQMDAAAGEPGRLQGWVGWSVVVMMMAKA